MLDADLQFADSAKAQFGTGNDLEIYHDASNSNIKDVGTGHLQVFADDLYILKADGSKQKLSLIQMEMSGCSMMVLKN